MCMGVETLALVISAASAATSYVAQDRQADAQQDAINQAHRDEQNMLQIQRQQVDQQASEEMSELALNAMRESSRINAILGETGGGGNSGLRIANEARFNAATDMATLENNRKNALQQNNWDRRAATASAAQRMANVNKPSLIGTGLQIAGGYADMKKYEQSQRTTKTYTK